MSTAIFVTSACRCWSRRPHPGPRLYSRGQLVLANVGNAINSVYVFSLPVGPIWFLHAFNLACTLLMLAWHLRYARPGTSASARSRKSSRRCHG